MTQAISIPELSSNISLAPHCWTQVLIPKGGVEQAAMELQEELAAALPEDQQGSGASHLFWANDPALINKLESLTEMDAAVIVGLEMTGGSGVRSLDLVRGRLVGGARVVFVLPLSSANLLRTHAPNIWSWIGARTWILDSGSGTLDVQAALQSLREGLKMTDEELLRLVEAGQLPLDPPVVEWLVLLGRGDLIP